MNRSLLLAVVAFTALPSELAWSTEPGDNTRKPVSFGGIPGGVSYAFAPDGRSQLPKIRHTDGSMLPAVRVRPVDPARYPEELAPEMVLESPDLSPAGLAFDGRALWLCGRETRRIYFLDPVTGRTDGSMPSPGPFPTGLAWDGSQMWHTDARARKLYGIVGGEVIREIPLDWHCVGVAATAEGLVIGDWESDTLRLFSPSQGKVLREIRGPDTQVFGLAASEGRLWCARRDALIVQDNSRALPVTSFSVAGRRPEGADLAGVAIVGKSLWFADQRNRRLVRIAQPVHGDRIAANGHQREASFSMTVRNEGPDDWQRFALLWNVAIYEMPGQRWLAYDIQPAPVAHYRDTEGNLHALFRRERLGKGEQFKIKATVRLWCADRWTFLDPGQSRGEIPEPWRQVCGPDFPRPRPLGDPHVQEFIRQSIGEEPNPYWKLRGLHDALLDRVVYAEPPDESVAGVLRTGQGVCRNFAACFETLGCAAGVPVLDAWAPRHNLNCAYLPGAGWSFIEITANNDGETANRRRRNQWFGGIPGGQLTTGVSGPCIAQKVEVDGRVFVNKRHCRLPEEFRGFRESDSWTNRPVGAAAK